MGIRGEKKKVKKAYEKPKPKPKKGQEGECFLFGKYMEVPGEWLTCREQQPFPMSCPVHLFHLAVPELYLSIYQ